MGDLENDLEAALADLQELKAENDDLQAENDDLNNNMKKMKL